MAADEAQEGQQVVDDEAKSDLAEQVASEVIVEEEEEEPAEVDRSQG